MDEGSKLFFKLSDILHGKYDSKYTSTEINFSKVFPEYESTANRISRLKKYLEKTFNLIKNCKNDHEGLFLLLEAGLSNLLVKATAVFGEEADVEGVTPLLDDLLEIVILISENGEKCQTVIVSSMCRPYLQLLVKESCSLVQKTEICRSLNLLLETCPFATKEHLLQQADFIEKLKDLFQLVIRVGDYEVQIGILECLFRLLPRKVRYQYASKFLPQSILVKFLDIRDVNFETDCRLFLNELNRTLGNNCRVYSVPCEKAILGKKQLKKPCDDDYKEFWIDFNYGSLRITLFCEQEDSKEFQSQYSQSELGLWETVSVSVGDVKAFSYGEENGIAVASIKLKQEMSILYPHMKQLHGTDFHIYVHTKHNMKKALMTVFGSEKFIHRKVSSGITPVQLKVERNNYQETRSQYNYAEQSNTDNEHLTVSSQGHSVQATPNRVKISIPCVPMSTPASVIDSPVSDHTHGMSSEENVQKCSGGSKLAQSQNTVSHSERFVARKTPTVKPGKPKLKTPVVEIGECPKKQDKKKRINKKKNIKEKEASAAELKEDNEIIPDSYPGTQKEYSLYQGFAALSDSGIDLAEVNKSVIEEEKMREQNKVAPNDDCGKNSSQTSKRIQSNVNTLEKMKTSPDLCPSLEENVIKETQEITQGKSQEDICEENNCQISVGIESSIEYESMQLKNSSQTKKHRKRQEKNKEENTRDAQSKVVCGQSIKDSSDLAVTSSVQSEEELNSLNYKTRSKRNKTNKDKKNEKPSMLLSKEKSNSSEVVDSVVLKSVCDKNINIDDVGGEDINVSDQKLVREKQKPCNRSVKKLPVDNKENNVLVNVQIGNTNNNNEKTGRPPTRVLKETLEVRNQCEENRLCKESLESKKKKGQQKRDKYIQSRKTSENKKEKERRKLPNRKAKMNQVYDESNISESCGRLFQSSGETISSCSSILSVARDDAKTNKSDQPRELSNRSGLYFPESSNLSHESDPYDFDAECESDSNLELTQNSLKSREKMPQINMKKAGMTTSKFFKHRSQNRQQNVSSETIATIYMKSWQQQLNKKKGKKVLSHSMMSWKSVEQTEDCSKDGSHKKQVRTEKNSSSQKNVKNKSGTSARCVSTNNVSTAEGRRSVEESFEMTIKKNTKPAKFKLFNPDLSLMMPIDTEINDKEKSNGTDPITNEQSASEEETNISQSRGDCENIEKKAKNHHDDHKKMYGTAKSEKKGKKKSKRPSPGNSSAENPVIENFSAICKTLTKTSVTEEDDEEANQSINEQVPEDAKEVTEVSDGEMSDDNKTIATSVRSEVSWIAKKTASRKKKIKKTYRRKHDCKTTQNQNSDEESVIESLRFRDDEMENLVMSSQEWGVPTQFDFAEAMTPKTSLTRAPSSKKKYSPLDVKLIPTPKTPKTPASFHYSDEETELLIEEDTYNYDVKVPNQMEILREYSLPLKDDGLTDFNSGLKNIQSGPSSTVRPSRSTLKRKYAHMSLEDDDMNSQDNLNDENEDISGIEFCPRKLFKGNKLLENGNQDIEDASDETKTPNLLRAKKSKVPHKKQKKETSPGAGATSDYLTSFKDKDSLLFPKHLELNRKYKASGKELKSFPLLPGSPLDLLSSSDEEEQEEVSSLSLHLPQFDKNKINRKIEQACPMPLLPSSPYERHTNSVREGSTLYSEVDSALDLTSDPGIEAGISTVVQAFGIDIQKQLQTKYNYLKEVTRGALRNSHKHLRNVWNEELENRGQAMEHFTDKMLEELLSIEADVTAMKEAEERSLTFCQQQTEAMAKHRSSQETRLRNLKLLHSSLHCSLSETENQTLQNQKKLRQIMKADLAALQKKLLFDTSQHQISNVKKCLKSMLF